MSKKSKLNTATLSLGIAIGISALVVAVIATSSRSTNFNLESEAASVKCNSRYNPRIGSRDFTTNITNKYFSLPPGKKLVYEGETEDGTERVEIEIEDPVKTKMVMGVRTLVYLDRVWLDGELVEDTRDYLAQNKITGDVWYFGEDVDNFEQGKLVNHDGSWLAGEDVEDTGKNARPGIWIKANPRRDETYLQECYEDVAEDTVRVLETDEKVTVPYGTFQGCVKTKDFTPLDPESLEHKYYCPGVGAIVQEVDLVSDDKLQLIDVEMNGDEQEDDVED